MFCTNCGKRIPVSAVRCQNCGQEQDRLEGGNGFWDMVDGPRQTSTPEPPPEPQKKNSNLPILFSVFSILLCVICTASVLILKVNVDKALNEISTEIEGIYSSFTALEALVGEIDSTVDEQKSEIASFQSIIENYEAKALTIETSEEMPEEVSAGIPEEPLEDVSNDVPEESLEESSSETPEQPVEIIDMEETEIDGR